MKRTLRTKPARRMLRTVLPSLAAVATLLAGTVPLTWAFDATAPNQRNAPHAEPEGQPGQQIFPTCTRCHGSDGLGPQDGGAPAIAGQYARVIMSELIDFRPRYANRHDPRMEQIASLHLLSQPYDVAQIAYYVSQLPRGRVPANGSGEWVSRGKEIYQSQCAKCHGASAQGSARRSVPWLASQHYEYLRREISYTTDQRRHNMDKDHAALFHGLSQQDIDGLADYLSRLPPS